MQGWGALGIKASENDRGAPFFEENEGNSCRLGSTTCHHSCMNWERPSGNTIERKYIFCSIKGSVRVLVDKTEFILSA